MSTRRTPPTFSKGELEAAMNKIDANAKDEENATKTLNRLSADDTLENQKIILALRDLGIGRVTPRIWKQHAKLFSVAETVQRKVHPISCLQSPVGLSLHPKYSRSEHRLRGSPCT